ncbi:short-chain dehydrogenase/reductase, partial [Streptomyces sp. NPDC059802]
FRPGCDGGGALRRAAEIPAYVATVGPVRTNLPGSDGKQEGDPDKAAAANLTALAAEETPLRLPLGNDAIDAIQAHLEAARAETLAWETVSRSTDFDE